MSNSTNNTVEQLRSSQIDQLERENKRLVEQLKEVIKMNTHWQRYDSHSQREEYVLKLTRTNQELQDKVSDLQQQLDDIDIVKGPEVKEDKPQVKEPHGAAQNEDRDDDELKDLRKDEEVALLTDCIAKLKDRIAELEKGRESRKKEDDEQLVLLREQVNVCVEDFKQERKDRERVHEENERLRERLADAEKRIEEAEEQMFVYEEQIKEFQRHNLRHPAPKQGNKKVRDEPCCYPEDRPHRHCTCRAPTQTRNTHHRPKYYGDDLADLPNDVEIDGFQDGDELQDETDGDDLADRPNDVEIDGFQDGDELQDGTDGVSIITTDVFANSSEKKDTAEDEEDSFHCPRCLVSFEIDRYDDLVNHINNCVQ